MTATNRMPEQQDHGKLYNKSLTNLQQFDNPKWVYDKSTTIQQVEWLESEHDRNSVRSGRKCPKMTKNCSHGNSLEGQQPNFAGIKKRRRSIAYFLNKLDPKEQYKLEAVLAVRVTWGHYGWCHSTADKISYIFLSLDNVPISHHFGVMAKNKFRRTKVGCHGNVPWKFKNRGSDRSSTAIAEPNGENRVKLHSVKVESKGLTESFF